MLDDPPERIAAWLSTVEAAAVDALDHQLLVDLLEIESDPIEWRDLLPAVVARIESDGAAGRLDEAAMLVGAIAKTTGEVGVASRAPVARDALQQLAQGPLLDRVVEHLRTGQSHEVEELCRALGPTVVPRLMEALSRRPDHLTQRRLVKILASFGTDSRAAAEQLMDASGWRLRSTAAYVIWTAGGEGALQAMERLLGDPEPRARGEAIRAIVFGGHERGREMLVEALVSGTASVRRDLSASLAALQDKQAAGFFAYLLRHAMSAKLPLAVCVRAMDTIAQAGADDAVDTLHLGLHAGRWWTPARTWRLRRGAARALRALGTPEALEALQDAVSHGSYGVYLIARQELAGGVK